MPADVSIVANEISFDIIPNGIYMTSSAATGTIAAAATTTTATSYYYYRY